MLSAFPATFSADTFLGNPFPPFESGIPPWEYQEPSFLFPQLDEPVAFSPYFFQEPVNSNSGSETQNPSPSSGSYETNRDETKTLIPDHSEPNRDNFKNKRPGSNEASRLDSSTTEERKRRRMISNRESARRSRMRKQRHLDNLRNQASRLKGGNREQTDRLRMVVHQTQLIRRENECLRAEALMLRQRLWDIRQVLVVRQLQQLYPTAMH